LVIFFIGCFNQTFADSEKKQVQPVKADPSQLYPLSDPNGIIGEWSFVYFKEYRSLADKNPPPPKFDMIVLGKPDSAREWGSSLPLTHL